MESFLAQIFGLFKDVRNEFKRVFTGEIAITIFSVLGVIFISVVLTLFIKEFVLEKDEDGISKLEYLMGAESSKVPITNYSVQQAHRVCSMEIRQRIGRNLQTLTYDPRSSRYQARKKTFKVFYDMTVADSQGGSMNSWAYCDVSSTTGELIEIRLKDTARGMFGF